MQLLVRSSIIGADRESPAEFISAHTACGRYLTDSGLPPVIVRPNLFLQNIPESFANALVGLYQDYRRSGTGGYAAQVTGTVERLTGRPPRSLDDLLNEIGPGLQAIRDPHRT